MTDERAPEVASAFRFGAGLPNLSRGRYDSVRPTGDCVPGPHPFRRSDHDHDDYDAGRPHPI